MAAFLDGFPRHAKMHPCGVVLSRDPIAALTPTFTSAKGYATTHFDMDAVEQVGLVKMDILAQGGLAVIRDALALLHERASRPTSKISRHGRTRRFGKCSPPATDAAFTISKARP